MKAKLSEIAAWARANRKHGRLYRMLAASAAQIAQTLPDPEPESVVEKTVKRKGLRKVGD